MGYPYLRLPIPDDSRVYPMGLGIPIGIYICRERRGRRELTSSTVTTVVSDSATRSDVVARGDKLLRVVVRWVGPGSERLRGTSYGRAMGQGVAVAQGGAGARRLGAATP